MYETIKRWVNTGLLILLLGVVLYALFTVKFTTFNTNLQFQTQDQSQSQATVILGGSVFTSIQLKTDLVTPESCKLQRSRSYWAPAEDLRVIKYVDCIRKTYGSKQFGYSVAPMPTMQHMNDLPDMIVTYWEVHKDPRK